MNVKLLTGPEMLNGKDLLDHSELCLRTACQKSNRANMSSEKAQDSIQYRCGKAYPFSLKKKKKERNGRAGTRLDVIWSPK